MNKLTDTFKLANGVEIPCVGFGTWQTPDGETAVTAVKAAIEAGYRHIDCAAIYGNEVGVGQGIKEGIAAAGIKREDLFITGKVWCSERGYEKTKAAFAKTLEDLQLDYLDLYLIHWPASSKDYEDFGAVNVDTWKAMTELYKEGKIRAIGISNFFPHHMEALLTQEIKPMVNQVRFHPGFHYLDETIELCKKEGILVEAYSPLGTGTLLDDPAVVALAEKYGKTTAQICIRYVLQKGILPLPKSITPARIQANTDVFGFELNAEDVKALDDVKNDKKVFEHPDSVPF